MSGIFGLLGYSDTDRVFLNTLGQSVVTDAVAELLVRYNDDLRRAMGVFVERQTSDHQIRYKLPGGGRLQRIAGQSQAGAVKTTGQWDVAFPLHEFGAQVAAGRKQFAYMTLQDLDRHLNTVFIQGVNTVRYEILRRLFKNTNDSFDDPNHGTLTVKPPANGDADLYPPVLGSEAEATEQHYSAAGYLATAISDTNNPFVTIRDELEEHFGAPTGGSDIVVFINPAETPETEALTDFDPVVDRFIRAGQDTDEPIGLPIQVPGKILGRTNGVWVSEWRWIPATYMVGVHLDAPPPLIERVHPQDTGLPSGLVLVSDSSTHPFEQSHYELDTGFGAGNRLNAVVMEVDTGAYAIPAGYA